MSSSLCTQCHNCVVTSGQNWTRSPYFICMKAKRTGCYKSSGQSILTCSLTPTNTLSAYLSARRITSLLSNVFRQQPNGFLSTVCHFCDLIWVHLCLFRWWAEYLRWRWWRVWAERRWQAEEPVSPGGASPALAADAGAQQLVGQLGRVYLLLHVDDGRSEQPDQTAHLVSGRRGHVLVPVHGGPPAAATHRATPARAALRAPGERRRSAPQSARPAPAPPHRPAPSALVHQPKIGLRLLVSSSCEWFQTMGERGFVLRKRAWRSLLRFHSALVCAVAAIPRGTSHWGTLTSPTPRHPPSKIDSTTLFAPEKGRRKTCIKWPTSPASQRCVNMNISWSNSLLREEEKIKQKFPKQANFFKTAASSQELLQGASKTSSSVSECWSVRGPHSFFCRWDSCFFRRLFSHLLLMISVCFGCHRQLFCQRHEWFMS